MNITMEVKRPWTPEGWAGLFLIARFPNASRADQLALAKLIRTAWKEGYDAAKRGDERE